MKKEGLTLNEIAEEIKTADVYKCAVVLLTNDGKVVISSYNASETDVIEMLRSTANMLVTDDIHASTTIH